MKGEVVALIKEMEGACRRPLFTGIGSSGGGSGGNTKTNTSVSPGARDTTPTESASFGYPESETGSNFSIPKAASSSRRSRSEDAPQRSWDKILADAAPLLPFMTDSEHGQVTRLASIFLLGFLLPQSTGNEFFLLENLSSKRLKRAGNVKTTDNKISGVQAAEYVAEKEDMGEYIIQMSLEERLEACPQRYHPDEFGEFDSIVFDPLEDAFQSFLHQGLAPFLSGRPSHTTEVDLLHILAMAIHPQPSEQAIPQTVAKLEEDESDFWDKAKRLMSNLTAPSFHVNYRHRLRLVRLVTDCLVVPTQNKARAFFEAPLFDGALPHLRAALYAFGMASIHPLDAHVAQCGMASLAIQCGIDHVVKEEWNRLSHRMVDDQTNYPTCPRCRCGTGIVVPMPQMLPSYDAAFSLVGDVQNVSFCSHRARGKLLQEFLTRYNEARCFAEVGFLQYALGSLTDAIEMQVDLWTQETEEQAGNRTDAGDADAMMGDIAAKKKTSQPTCVLASLLGSAKYLFYFLLPIKEEKKEPNDDDEEEEQEESEESYRRDMLISCGIQLIHHWDSIIVRESCTMLLLAFSYAKEIWGDYVGAVFESVKIWVKRPLASDNEERGDSTPCAVESLVSAFSQRSSVFATNVMKFLLKEIEEQKVDVLRLHRLVAAVAVARPYVAEQSREALEKCLRNSESSAVVKHVVASLLSCRKARYFTNEMDSELKLKSIISNASLGGWQRYQIARHCMVTGNFSAAKTLLHDLSTLSHSEKNFVWLHALQQVSEGEAALAMEAAIALRESSAYLTMAICTLRSMQPLLQFEEEIDCSCEFQIGFLELRVSFLDLLTAVRQLTREMRLVGSGPKKYTRPHLHLKNLVRGFFGLGHQYLTFYKQNGLFLCQQSRSVLRTLRSLCDFVGRALQRVFHESLSDTSSEKSKKAEDEASPVMGDSSQPLTLLLKQLESFAVKDMDPAVQAKIRAAAMLEIMDGILKSPFPFPKSFMVTKSIPRSELQVMWDPKVHTQAESLHVLTDGLFSLLVCGKIEKSTLSRAELPFSIVLLWYILTPRGKSTKNESKVKSEAMDEISSRKSKLHPLSIASSLSSSGMFFMKVSNQALPGEGSYDIDFRLGCRDIRGGEWELPISEPPSRLTVELRRSG